MPRRTKTTSERWEVKGDPNDPRAKWECKPGEEWRSKRTGVADLEKVKKWVEDMEEWSEMMYEAVIELRERVAPIAVIQQDLYQLSELMASFKQDLKPTGGAK